MLEDKKEQVREIKFRAWDKENKEMSEGYTIEQWSRTNETNNI